MSDIEQGHDEGALLAVAAPAQEEVPAPGRARSTSQLPLERLRGFHPGWFGAVMGTAIVGVAASMNPGGAASLASSARTFSQTMVVIAVVIAVVLVVGYLGRFVLHTDAALADLRDPVAGALYGTLPGASSCSLLRPPRLGRRGSLPRRSGTLSSASPGWACHSRLS